MDAEYPKDKIKGSPGRLKSVNFFHLHFIRLGRWIILLDIRIHEPAIGADPLVSIFINQHIGNGIIGYHRIALVVVFKSVAIKGEKTTAYGGEPP
jgi:hypothetical protein